MVCLEEKFKAGVAGAAVGGSGMALIASTTTGPGFFGVAVSWLVACANYGFALAQLAICLESNGHPEMAAVLREKSDAILQEIENFKAWARSIGASL